MSTQTEAAQAVAVGGFVAPGFEAVREELARSFSQRGELGAAFAAVRDGEPVVDLWGGLADRESGRPWREDTLVLVYSGTKGLVAACMLMLIERGQLELDAPVAEYWPEFAQAGKAHVRVRDVVAHTARLPFLETSVTWQEATDSVRMAELLAAQRQSDDPRAAYSYHPLTYGWLCGELVRRVDGRTVGRFFAEEIAGPLELDLWIGLPEEQEPRVATLEPAPGYGIPPGDPDDPYMQKLWGVLRKGPLAGMPENERAWHAAEIPGANAIGDARSIARFYASLERVLRPETLALGTRPISTRLDIARGCVISFGVGFGLQTPQRELGPPLDAFGHGGAGGSRHGCWPTQRIGFSYAMNRLDADAHALTRGSALLGALHRCVAETEAGDDGGG
jgi:CubicO group peptidase (beta-lactamase class C family)